LKCVDALTINEEFRLRCENERLEAVNKSEIAQLKQQAEEYKNVKLEVDRLTKMTTSMFDKMQEMLKQRHSIEDPKAKQQHEQEIFDLFHKFEAGNEQLSNLSLKKQEMKDRLLNDLIEEQQQS